MYRVLKKIKSFLKEGHSRHLFLCFVFSTVNSKYVHYKILPMTGFEPWTSAIESDRSTNWATTISQEKKILFAKKNRMARKS